MQKLLDKFLLDPVSGRRLSRDALSRVFRPYCRNSAVACEVICDSNRLSCSSSTCRSHSKTSNACRIRDIAVAARMQVCEKAPNLTYPTIPMM